MGRKASVNLNLPKGMRARRRVQKKSGQVVTWYYFDVGGKPRKEIPLGSDYITACKKWAEISLQKLDKCHKATFVSALHRFLLEEIPEKATNTQLSYKKSAKNLEAFFGGDNPVLLDDIDAGHIRDYLKWRKKAPVSANRELSLFNTVWTLCGEANWGYTTKISPTAGIKKNKEKPRDVYVDDQIYNILYKCATEDLKDAMVVALMFGQRPCDILKIHTNHIQKKILSITQNKTGNTVRFWVTEKVKEIVNRLAPNGGYLFLNKRKGKMSTSVLRTRFSDARKLAISQHPELAEQIAKIQFRDLRAKAATDKSFLTNDEEARKLLGHTSVSMTQKVYIRLAPVISPHDPELD